MTNTFYFALIACTLFAFGNTHAQTHLIHTVAGGGVSTVLGDGGPATAAYLEYPTSIYIMPAYPLDGYNIYSLSSNRIRYTSPAGIIETFIGNGTGGYSGDGGAPADATINTTGNIFLNCFCASQFSIFSDTKNNVIRKKISDGGITTIHTIIGNGIAGFSGDGGPATAAQLDTPGSGSGYSNFTDSPGVAGFIFADKNNNRIRLVNEHDTITTIAGNGIAGFSGDGGPATAASLDHPTDVKSGTYHNRGAYYIADWGNRRIRKVDTLGIITTIAGNGSVGYSGDGGPATAASIGTYGSLVVDQQDNLFIAGGASIRRIDTSGIITTVAGNGTFGFSGDGGPATAAMLSEVWSASFDMDGNLYIADAANNRIRKVDSIGALATPAIAANKISLQLSPNPNKGSFTMTGNVQFATGNNAAIKVTDITGKTMYTDIVKLQNGIINKQLKLNSLANGVYMLYLTANGESSAVKFEVER